MSEQGWWGGLCRPDLPVSRADVVVAGIPYDGGVSFRSGAAGGPEAVRSITFTVPPTTERGEDLRPMAVVDAGDVTGASRQDLFRQVQDLSAHLVREGRFFTFLGGDHSVTIPILAGVDRVFSGRLGVIQLDAHLDLCPDMDGDTLSHGSTACRALELASVGSLENLAFVGTRSMEVQELPFLGRPDLTMITAQQFHRWGRERSAQYVVDALSSCQGVYLTIDIDVLDPAYAPGTGTPQMGGLDGRQLLDFLEGIFKLPIIGFDLVEVAPRLDPSDITLFAARKIIFECWGHYWRKQGR